MSSKIPTVTFQNYELETIMKGLALEQVKQVTFDKLIPNLKYSILKKKKECIFCYVEDYQIVIQKDSYASVCEKLIEFYSIKEDYVKCAELRDLKEKINE